MLRNLKRREDQLAQSITRIKNRIKGHLNFIGVKFISWAGGSLKIMEEEAKKRDDYTLQSMLRELRFFRSERIQVIRDERECLKQLNREEIQENIQSVPGIGFRTATALQAELWDMTRFQNEGPPQFVCRTCATPLWQRRTCHGEVRQPEEEATPLSDGRGGVACCPVQSGIQSKIWSSCGTRDEFAEGHCGYCKEADADDPGRLASGQKVHQPPAGVQNELNFRSIP